MYLNLEMVIRRRMPFSRRIRQKYTTEKNKEHEVTDNKINSIYIYYTVYNTYSVHTLMVTILLYVTV